MYKRVVVTGSLAFDHIMSMPGKFKDHILPDKLHILNVSFIMNTFRQEFGGTGGNIAWGLGLLGIPSVLAGAVGNDFGPYKKHLLRLKNIDLSGLKVYKDMPTARGFVTTDKDDNQIWGFYEGAMKMSGKFSINKYLGRDTLLMIAPNDPSAMLRYVNEALGSNTPYVFDPAFNIIHFNIQDLRKAVTKAKILIGNDYEIELIRRRLKWSKGVMRVKANIIVTTKGRDGVRIENKSKVTNVPAAHPDNESDPTGAGDAFRAGFLAGFVQDLPLEICGKMGAVAAVYTVEKYGTQTHFFTKKQFISRFRKNYPEDIIFNI
jgi:adenosine kinase